MKRFIVYAVYWVTSIFLVGFYSAFIWIASWGNFELSYPQALSITVMGYFLFRLTRGMERNQNVHEIAIKILDEQKNPTKIEKSPEELKLDEYRRTFGQSEKR